MNKLLNVPVGIWIMAGFFIVYVALYLNPVFLNTERSIHYLTAYLPDKRPIGQDLRLTMSYLEEWIASGRSPYFDKFLPYPPFVFILFAPMLLIGYPAYYYLMTFLTLGIFIASGFLLARFAGTQKVFVFVLFIVSFFSYGFQFEIERGQFNIIAYSLCLIAVGLCHTDDRYRYPAFGLFTIGTQMKIYPAILILMLVKDWRDWKSNIRNLFPIALINIALLFVMGFGEFGNFIATVLDTQAFANSWNGNHSIKAFLYEWLSGGYGTFRIGGLGDINQVVRILELVMLGVIVICIFSNIFRSYRDRMVGFNPALLLMCTVAGLVIPSISNDYKLPILTLPMAVMWGGLSLPILKPQRIISILLLLLTSAAYWSVQYPPTVKPQILDRNFPALFVLIISVALLDYFSRNSRVANSASL